MVPRARSVLDEAPPSVAGPHLSSGQRTTRFRERIRSRPPCATRPHLGAKIARAQVPVPGSTRYRGTVSSVAPIATPIPAAPAAPTWQSDPSLPIAAPPPVPPMPPDALTVPVDLVGQLNTEVLRALKDVTEWMKTRGDVNLFLLPYFVIDRLPKLPTDEQQREELAQLHDIASKRTPALNARAAWLADHGMHELWDGFLAEYAKKVGPEQARKAVQLLHDTLLATEGVGLGAKNKLMRKRPYVVDPKLQTIVSQPPDNPSFPSGHTAAAFAAAIVMSYLMPERAPEFQQLALEMAYSRMYGGVHFPSDVVCGAYVGAFVGMAMVQLSVQRDKLAGQSPAGKAA